MFWSCKYWCGKPHCVQYTCRSVRRWLQAVLALWPPTVWALHIKKCLTLHKLAFFTVSCRAFVYCISCRVVARSFLVATTLYNGDDVVVFKPFNIAIFRTAPPVSPLYVLLHVFLYVSKTLWLWLGHVFFCFGTLWLGRSRLITTLKFPALTSSTIMLAAEHYLDFFADSALLP